MGTSRRHFDGTVSDRPVAGLETLLRAADEACADGDRQAAIQAITEVWDYLEESAEPPCMRQNFWLPPRKAF